MMFCNDIISRWTLESDAQTSNGDSTIRKLSENNGIPSNLRDA